MSELYFILSLERTERGKPWFWKPNHWGYTEDITGAGKYPRSAAYRIMAQSDGQDVPIPVSAYAHLSSAEVPDTAPDSTPHP